MDINKEEILCIMKFYFLKSKNVFQITKKINAVYGADTVSDRTVREWFARFRSKNFDVRDAPRCGRSISQKIDEIIQNVEKDRHISSHEIAENLGIHHQIVLNHLEIC